MLWESSLKYSGSTVTTRMSNDATCDATLGWFYDSVERNDPPTGRVYGGPYGVHCNPHEESNCFSH